MQFERSFELPLSTNAVWSMLWNVEHMVRCIPGCTGATVVEDQKRYRATIVETVGPFKLEIPLEIEISSIDVGRSMRMRAVGKDRRIGTEVTWDLALKLEPQGEHTKFHINLDAIVVGRLVSLGQAVIKLKGNQTLTRFAESLHASLITANRVT